MSSPGGDDAPEARGGSGETCSLVAFKAWIAVPTARSLRSNSPSAGLKVRFQSAPAPSSTS